MHPLRLASCLRVARLTALCAALLSACGDDDSNNACTGRSVETCYDLPECTYDHSKDACVLDG